MGNPYLDDLEAQTQAMLASTGARQEDYAKDASLNGMDSSVPGDVVDADPSPAKAPDEAPTTPPGDPKEELRLQALRNLVALKYPKHQDDTGLLSDEGAGKASLAFYRAGGGKNLKDDFFKPVDHTPDAIKAAQFEIARANAESGLLGKKGGAAGNATDGSALYEYLKAKNPDAIKAAGPTASTASPVVLKAIGALEGQHETDVDKHSTAAKVAADKARLEDPTAYVDALPDDHPALKHATRDELKRIPLPILKALAGTTVANEAVNTKETTKAVEKAGPIVAAQTASGQLRGMLDKYGNKLPGIGPIEGHVPESLLGPALSVGSALGHSSPSPEAADDARKTRQLMGQLVTEIEQAKGGARAVSNQQSQSRLAEAYGLVKTGTPANLKQALDILDAVKAEEIRGIKTAHPRGAAAVDALRGPAAPPAPADHSSLPEPPPGKKYQFNRNTGQYRLVDEVQ